MSSASEFLPARLRAHLTKFPIEQDNEREVTSDQADSVADFLLKSTVFINKAYAAVRGFFTSESSCGSSSTVPELP